MNLTCGVKEHMAISDPVKLRLWHKSRSAEDDTKAFRVAVRILDELDFSEEEKRLSLGFVSKLPEEPLRQTLTVDQRTRVSLILGIHKALSTLFLQPKHRVEWITNTNSKFDGYSPKDMLLSGSLIEVYRLRDYLESNCW